MRLKTGAVLVAACAILAASLVGCGGGSASANPTSASSSGPAARTVSGTVSYAGSITLTHQIIIVAVRSGEQSPAYSKVIQKPGPYTIDGVADGSYLLSAFMDLGDDMGPPGANEPAGLYDSKKDGTADPVVIQNGVGLTGIDIVLVDK